MSTPLPPRILALIREQEREVARVDPKSVKRLVAISKDIARQMEARLRGMAPGRYSTTETRTVLAQIKATIDLLGTKFGVDVGGQVKSIYTAGAQAGRDALQAQMKAWDAEGLLPEGLGAKANVGVASDLLDPGLLELHEVSVRAYGSDAITKMRGELARGSLAGETLPQTWERMAKAVDIPPWKAERIVRTEHSYALHRRQLLDMPEMFGDRVDEWRKELVATLDARTGADSVFVNHQTRKIDEPFEDNIGHVYQHPPNRPNDREVVVMVPAEVVASQADNMPAGSAGTADAPPKDTGSQVGRSAVSPKNLMPPPRSDSPHIAMVGPRGRPGKVFGDGRNSEMQVEAEAWQSQLPSDEQHAVARWSTDWRPLRRALVDRQKGRFDQVDMDDAIRLVSALHKAPKWSGEAYRGIGQAQLIDDLTGGPVKIERDVIFGVGILRAFSLDSHVARRFAAQKGQLAEGILIVVKKGPKKGMAYIAAASSKEFRHQQELVSLESVKYRILRVGDLETIEREEDGRRVAYRFRRLEVEAL